MFNARLLLAVQRDEASRDHETGPEKEVTSGVSDETLCLHAGIGGQHSAPETWEHISSRLYPDIRPWW